MKAERQLLEVAARIRRGELQAEAAFDAIVDVIAATETPLGAPPGMVASIRDQVVLGVSHDRDLCALLYAAPKPTASRPQRTPPAAATIPAPAPPARPSLPPKPSRPRRPPRTAKPRKHDRRGRRPDPASESLDDLPPQMQRDRFEAEFVRPGRRSPLITAGIVAGAIVVAAAGYLALAPSPCSDLATQVCRDLEGACSSTEVLANLEAGGIGDDACQRTIDAVQEAAEAATSKEKPRAYREALVATVGFDPRRPHDAPVLEDPDDGPPPVEVLPIVAGQTSMSSMAVDPSHLYWTVTQPPAVYRILAIGGEPELVSQSPMPGQLATSENFAYWISGSGATATMWADKKRGEHDPASIDLVPGHAPGLVAFMGPEAAFVDAVTGAVQIVAVAHDTPRTLAPPSPQIPTAIAGDGQTVFWLTPAPAVSLNSAPREEGAPTVLAQGLTAASLLRLDDTSVYWVEPGAGTIHAMPKTGGSVRTVAAAGPGTSDLVSDGTRLFWTNAKTGTVSGVPVGGGEVQTLVTDLDEPRFVAVDGAAVFFESGGTVYRRPK